MAMEGIAQSRAERGRPPWRAAAWVAAGLVLLVPWIAEFDWTVGDFVLVALLLFGSLGAYEIAVRLTASSAYRAGAAVGLIGVFLLVSVNGAVGITDSGADAFFLLLVLPIGILGVIVARFRAAGMAQAMFTTAIATASVGVVALITGAVPEYNSAFEILALTGFFVTIFVASALLFRLAADGRPEQLAG
jgi:hypothetical protein